MKNGPLCTGSRGRYCAIRDKFKANLFRRCKHMCKHDFSCAQAAISRSRPYGPRSSSIRSLAPRTSTAYVDPKLWRILRAVHTPWSRKRCPERIELPRLVSSLTRARPITTRSHSGLSALEKCVSPFHDAFVQVIWFICSQSDLQDASRVENVIREILFLGNFGMRIFCMVMGLSPMHVSKFGSAGATC